MDSISFKDYMSYLDDKVFISAYKVTTPTTISTVVGTVTFNNGYVVLENGNPCWMAEDIFENLFKEV